MSELRDRMQMDPVVRAATLSELIAVYGEAEVARRFAAGELTEEQAAAYTARSTAPAPPPFLT